LQRRMATCKRGSQRYRRLRRLKARIEARAARQRRERLHVWTTAIARTFAELTIVSPSIKETTRSGRGTERSHGAAVAVKAALNRHILAMAPATAVAMLEYKIAERGGMAQVVRAGSHPAELGNAIVSATQENRKLRRAIRNAH
jgi:putative transposase